MKTPFLPLFALILAAPSANAAELIKSCSMDLGLPGETQIISTKMEILKDDSGLYSLTTQTIDGEKIEMRDSAEIFEGKVRADLNILSEPADLNMAEKLVAHAKMWALDPDLKKFLNLDFDLNAIRFAKVYQVGEATNMGLAGIVEAYDQEGKLLGSYLGGFFVAQCK